MATSSGFLQFTTTGNPAEVIQVAERELPAPKGHEVRVRMRYAPVNPADLNFIEGTYGRAATPPCIPGIEGCGEVEAVGPEVESLAPGDVVIPLLGTGCWVQHLTVPEHALAKVPPQIDRVQAAMLRVNPVTAWRLLRGFVELEKGEWVVQNAAAPRRECRGRRQRHAPHGSARAGGRARHLRRDEPPQPQGAEQIPHL